MSGTIGNIGRVIPGLQNRVQFNPPEVKSDKEASFTDVLSNMINSVNDLQLDAGKVQELAATGEAADLHDVMIALEKAGVSMDLLMEIRNKLVDAYQTLVKMPM